MRNETEYGLHPNQIFSKTARDWVLSSALYDGIEDEDIRQIETLLSEKGANPNVLLPEYGITPFHLVVANESTNFAVQATDICLQHGADPNVRSEDGLTPVHLAAMWGCPDVLQVLLASGGNPWLVDCFNKNAFQYAQSEGQSECYNILTHHCGPKHNHPGSPYRLNLKRVILYKNDLQIEYEATPSGSRKCAATQTGSSFQQPQEVLKGLSGVENIAEEVNQNRLLSIEENINESFINFLERKERKKINGVGKNDDVSAKNHSHIVLNNKVKEVIVRHRKNSTIFEYSPSKQTNKISDSEIISSDDVSKDEVTSSVSKLIERLEKTNIYRQSLKSMDGQNDRLRNVTRRKKKPFILEESASPPSIGFILDNVDKTSYQTRGSSLFSDIASDVEAHSTPEQEVHNISAIMTEDEHSGGEKCLTRYSSSDSLYPYVSCEEGSTRERETSECFQTCIGISQSVEAHIQTEVNNSETFVDCSVPGEVNSVIDFILNSVDTDKRTPLNPRLITSTPERLACGSDGARSSSDTERRGWIEANVLSSDEEQYLSISEEYEYTDMDKGVVLIEKRYLLNDSVSTVSKKPNMPSSSTEESEVSTVSGSDAVYDTDELRLALRNHGFAPGPITGNTKQVYLRKLKRCKRHPPPPPPAGQPAYSPELLKTMNASCEHLLLEWAHLEDSMSASFTLDMRQRPWREGHAKTSFTYLLLDPRLAHDLPARAATMQHIQLWPAFLQSIFYVGKGKRARPYAHLYQAVAVWQQKRENCNSKKVLRILDIWQAGLGVVCLHVFQNIIPVEALTREAAMISALTLPQLTNEKAGEFYGSAGCWSLRQKRRLGCVLLHRAFKVFLAEGERQLRPADID